MTPGDVLIGVAMMGFGGLLGSVGSLDSYADGWEQILAAIGLIIALGGWIYATIAVVILS